MKNLIFNPWSFGLVMIFAVMFGLSLRTTGQKARITRDQLEQLQTETSQLESSVASKTAQASKSAQPFMKEKIARDELLLIKPGEVVMELPPIVAESTQADVGPTQTPWQAWQ
jgi:cell division protein FtsB